MQCKKSYYNITRMEFLSMLEKYLSTDELEEMEFIYNLAKCGHKGQSREEGIRFFEHPKSVALIAIIELEICNYTIVAKCLLHDIMEDTYLLTIKTLKKHFGRNVTNGIKHLTKDQKEIKKDYIYRIFKEADIETIIVKLCDRLHNLRTLEYCDNEKQIRIIDETKKLFLPQLDYRISKLKLREKKKYLKALEYLRKEINNLCE